jgi:UDP-glucuronate 4-epimerase
MSGRRILLTGGAGFVGSNLLDALVARGDRVTVIDNFNTYYDPAIKWANLEAHRGDPCVEVIEGDICDDGLWQALDPAAGWNAVLHVAARAGVRPSLEQPLLYVRCNVAGTAAALRWACSGATPIPFLFASSSSVYGDDNVPPYSEQGALPAPVSPYGSSKLVAEALVRGWASCHGLPVAILRFFTVYGPRQRPDLAIHKFARLIGEGQPIPVFGDGTSARDYTHVSDIVAGVLAAEERLLAGELPHQIYNLGSDRTISLHEMIEVIEGAVGRKARIDRLPMQTGDVRQTWADLERSRTELGYSPQVPFVEGVEGFVRWLRGRRR